MAFENQPQLDSAWASDLLLLVVRSEWILMSSQSAACVIRQLFADTFASHLIWWYNVNVGLTVCSAVPKSPQKKEKYKSIHAAPTLKHLLFCFPLSVVILNSSKQEQEKKHFCFLSANFASTCQRRRTVWKNMQTRKRGSSMMHPCLYVLRNYSEGPLRAFTVS